jgi:glycopeptide antibiotics resistance protein
VIRQVELIWDKGRAFLYITRKKILWGILAAAYIASIAAMTMLVHGRSLQQWVTEFIPPGHIQKILLYPLQNHHPVTFAKLIVFGDFLSNIFLFIPLGMIIFLVFDRVFLYSQKYVFHITLFIAVSFSVCIELVQYTVPKRIPSASDVLANTAGALLGCSVFYIRQRLQKQALAKASEQKSVSGPEQ